MVEKPPETDDEAELLDWWRCDGCGATGNSTIAHCPECGSMQIGHNEGGVDLPPCWTEDPAVAAHVGVERLWLHLDGPGFIGMEDDEIKLVRAEIRHGEDPDPETRPATAENVRDLAETFNNEFYGADNGGLGGAST